ncbi:OmpA family protein [Aquiflexum lacus]|uniref:OmpA family protein n=1 Tax=Aquiflexum lacus TaxID=2483805 RepID=UPI00189319CA|nr:OmpA family protein [Aquiflexum lacus]
MCKPSYFYLSKASRLFLLAFSFFFTARAQELIPLSILNSPYDEQSPVISPNEELFFTVGFNPMNIGGPTDYGDIWMSKKDPTGEWQIPQHVPSLSTSGNDVIIGFLDALTALVYHSGNNNKRQGIHQYSRFGNSWNYLRPLEMGSFKNNAMHFSGRLVPQGNVIVMSMNSYGTFGNEDIYISFKQSESVWTSPLNLGPQVNSFAQEQTPYLSNDLMTIYFSSNVHGNGRGKDIYFSQRQSQSWEDWTPPQKIDLANSTGSELSYTLIDQSDKMAIFTTTQNSEGFGDFMMIQFEPKAPLASLEIIETIPESLAEEKSVIKEDSLMLIAESENNTIQETVPIVNEAVIIQEETLSDEENISASSIARKLVRIINGQTLEEVPYQIEIGNERGLKRVVETQDEIWEMLQEPQWNTINIISQGFLPKMLDSSDWYELEGKDLLLQPAISGTAIVLDNIQFNRGTSDFADSKSIQVLDNLVIFMKVNEHIKIRLEGHTDNAGDPTLNKDLSMKRASKIRAYLTINGVDFERVRISGWGGSRPIADNQTEEGRVLNRRVEMLIEN